MKRLTKEEAKQIMERNRKKKKKLAIKYGVVEKPE